jgi:hypothetical protein
MCSRACGDARATVASASAISFGSMVWDGAGLWRKTFPSNCICQHSVNRGHGLKAQQNAGEGEVYWWGQLRTE